MMTDLETEAHELVRRKDWVRAIELYDQLLGGSNATKQPINISRERVVACLLGRSECCLELGRHELVVSDCRRIIKLLADGNEQNCSARARRRLVHALFSLRRFSEAEISAREWIALNGTNNGGCPEEAVKMLEKLKTVLQMANGHKTLSTTASDCFLDKRNVSSSHTCTYCSLAFGSRAELRAHCLTDEHRAVIASDDGRDWRWRAPPRGHTGDSYRMCEQWLTRSGICRNGDTCADAHGPEELSEWRERYEYRKSRLQRAAETELYGKSYTEQLLDRWSTSSRPDRVMCERIEGVEDCCDSDLATAVSTKCADREWKFELKTCKQLHAVALLQDAHRTHFSITMVEIGGTNKPARPTNDQEWILDTKSDNSSDNKNTLTTHRVTVRFTTEIYGTFRQSVVFDFGIDCNDLNVADQPVLVKHLCVDVLPVNDADRIADIKREITLSNCERWTDHNADVVPYIKKTPAPTVEAEDDEGWERSLLAMYPCPTADTFILTRSTVADERPTRNNYRSRMHELLYVEEMARYEHVARYNVTARLRLASSYLLAGGGATSTSTAKYALPGELFAVMRLERDVSEDTSAGRLVLGNCTSVLVAKSYEDGEEKITNKNNKRKRVYEAPIEDRCRSAVYFRLPHACVEELRLSPDSELQADVQFQLNRVPYCEWHHSVDRVHELRVIFPDTYVEPVIPWTPAMQWPQSGDIDDQRLNAKQREAVLAITAPREPSLPPILVVGPFGTGKTYTLAQAIRRVLKQPDSRVLVCTHSNSAADLYVKDYMHPWVEAGDDSCKPLRIYYHRRWVATVHPTVQKYCLIEDTKVSSGGGTSTITVARRFRPPTLDELMSHRLVVVTLSSSMRLAAAGVPRGHFTHIVLDEAAQAIECEAIAPLALADERTRVVLAGDHMQLSPELFSSFARERGLHISLLERLYESYPPAFPCKILLCENYRAHEAIVKFTSELFYEQKLVASGRQPAHDSYYPLTFFTARGDDVQDGNSTAYHNDSEVYELVERVSELRRRWPAAWGRADDQHSIGVVTPYADQVFRIRSELRKRRMAGVSVELVLNVQGKQFRAVFLSTVRTRRTCVTKSTDSAGSGDDGERDYGFLSNSRLLNTAMTRAQSLVAVVGDPVALCTVGRCRKVWERFLQLCDANNSLHGITWRQLRSQLDGVELRKTYVLNPLAPEFIPRRLQQQQHEAYIRLQQQQLLQQQQQQQRQQQAMMAAAVAAANSLPAQQPNVVGGIIPQQRAFVQPPPQLVPIAPTIPPQTTTNAFVRPQPPIAAAAPVFFVPQPGAQTQPIQVPQTNQPQQQFVQGSIQPQTQAYTVVPMTGQWTVANTAIGCPLSSPPQQPNPIPRQIDERQLNSWPMATGMNAPLPLGVRVNNNFSNGETNTPDTIAMMLRSMNENTPNATPTNSDHIQFLHNVHFPERVRTHEFPYQQQEVGVPSLLLPPGMTALDMLLAPHHHQIEWCRYLNEKYGSDAARRFIEMIQQQQQLLSLRRREAEAQRNVVAARQLSSPWPPTSQTGMPSNSNVSQACVMEQQQQQQQQQQRSVPLYRRQGPPMPGIEIANRGIPTPPQQQRMPPIANQLNRDGSSDWRHQINAEFAALNLGATDAFDDAIGRTYASVLASKAPPQTPIQQNNQQQFPNQMRTEEKVPDPFAILRELGQKITQTSTAAAAVGSTPQLYQYFS